MQSPYDPSRMANDRFVVMARPAGAGHEQSFEDVRLIPGSGHSLCVSQTTGLGSIPITRSISAGS